MTAIPVGSIAPYAQFRGADDGIRTRDPHLGKVVLYQLSHVRMRRKERPPVRPLILP